jgi:ribosome recycling factor
MATDAIMNEAKEKMIKAEESLQRELGQIRAGRANASLLDRVQVVYYGAPTPLNQIASITVPEARVLMVTPFDKTAIGDIDKAIQSSDIGITPNNDGNVIRLVIPQLTEERRKELAKEVKKTSEGAKVAIRNVRRDAMDSYKKQQKNGDLTEDDLRDLEKNVQTLTDSSIKAIDTIVADKEKELLTV